MTKLKKKVAEQLTVNAWCGCSSNIENVVPLTITDEGVGGVESAGVEAVDVDEEEGGGMV